MNLILTMAGRYMRFISEGYKFPKYLLPWGNQPILTAIIRELNRDKVFSDIFLIANQRDQKYMPHVRKILSSLAIPVENLILINDTKGQTETAKVGLDHIMKEIKPLDCPVVFHNIDTILYRRDLRGLAEVFKSYAGYIDVFRTNNQHYSYVLLNENREVYAIKEKVVISDCATSGLYGFASAATFLEYYVPEELYISEVYKRMVEANVKVLASPLNKEKDTIVLGTPQEYIKSSYFLDILPDPSPLATAATQAPSSSLNR